MSRERFYPPLDEKSIRKVYLIFETDPSYFEDPNCPYSKETKEIFKGQTKASDFDSHANAEISQDSDDILNRIGELSSKLKQYWNDMNKTDAAPADKNTYFRLEAMLLEKLIDYKEKMSKIKEYEAFTYAILEVLDKELNPDQRTVIMERLRLLSAEPQTRLTEPQKQDSYVEHETTEGKQNETDTQFKISNIQPN